MVSPANSKRSALSPRIDFLGFITGFNRALGMLCSSKQIARLRFWEKNGENIIEHLMSNLFKFSKLQHCRLGHTFSGASRLQLRPGILHSLTITADPSAAFSTGSRSRPWEWSRRQRHLVLRNTLKVFPNLGRETDHSKVSHEVISLYQSTFQEMVCKSPCGLQMHGCAIRSLFLGTVPAVTNHSTPSPF